MAERRIKAMMILIVDEDDIVVHYHWEGNLAIEIERALTSEAALQAGFAFKLIAGRIPEVSTMTPAELAERTGVKTGPEHGPQIQPSIAGIPFRCEECTCNVFTVQSDGKTFACNGCKATYDAPDTPSDPSMN